MDPLRQPLPDLASLDLLVSVAALGSISAGAGAHGLTQPAASMRLRSLERVLGVQLLERARTGSRLTPAGEAVVEWAGAVLEEVRGLLAGVAALRSGTSSLEIAASLTVAEYLLPHWLEQLAARAPASVSLQMGNTARVAEMVEHGDTELGFIEGPRPPGRLRTRDLVRDQLAVVVGVRHPWARRRRPVTAAELASTPLLLRERGSGTRDVLATALAGEGRPPTAHMELGSTTAIKAAAVTGAAPAVLPLVAVIAELRAGQLVAVDHAGVDLVRTIRAIWRTDHTLSPAAQRLLAIAQAPLDPSGTLR